MVKNLPTMQETWVQSLGQEDPLEDGMATHSSILAWKNPMDRGAWWAMIHGVAKSWPQLKRLSTHEHIVNSVFCLFEEIIISISLFRDIFSGLMIFG